MPGPAALAQGLGAALAALRSSFSPLVRLSPAPRNTKGGALAAGDAAALAEAVGQALGNQLTPAISAMGATLEGMKRQGEDDKTLG